MDCVRSVTLWVFAHATTNIPCDSREIWNEVFEMYNILKIRALFSWDLKCINYYNIETYLLQLICMYV